MSLNVGPKPFDAQGETGSWEFFLDCMVLFWGWDLGQTVSQPFLPFLMWVFSHSRDM